MSNRVEDIAGYKVVTLGVQLCVADVVVSSEPPPEIGLSDSSEACRYLELNLFCRNALTGFRSSGLGVRFSHPINWGHLYLGN